MSLFESLVDGIMDVRTHVFRTLLQTLGIVLGVASVVVTVSLIDSGRQQSMKVFEETGGLRRIYISPNWQESVRQSARDLNSRGLVLDDVRALRAAVPAIETIDPMAMRQMLVGYFSYRDKHPVLGVSPEFLQMNTFSVARGRFISSLDLDYRNRIAVLGSSVAQGMFGSANPLNQVITLDSHRFTVVGVLAPKDATFRGSQGNVLDWMNWRIHIPLTTLLTFYQGDQRLAWIGVDIAQIDQVKDAQARIEQILTRRHGTQDFRVHNRQESIDQYRQQSQAFEIIFLVTGAVSLLVGGIVIMNILLASFHERVREVGIRKALGATGFDITAQFLVESVLITVMGGVIGIVSGSALAHIVGQLLDQPIDLTVKTLLIAFSFSVGVGIFFGFYPAIKAARLNPIEALRYE